MFPGGKPAREYVRVAQGGQVLILQGKLGQVGDDLRQLGQQQVEGIADEDEVGIVSDVARGGSDVNETGGGGGILLECVDVGHDIVTADTFFFSDDLEGCVADDEVCANGIEGLVVDLGEADLLLGLGQPEPQLSPGGCPLARGEDLLHLRAWRECVLVNGRVREDGGAV